MYKILNRARAIPLRETPSTSFPGSVYLDPLEVPVFRLTIINNLSVGDLAIGYGVTANDFVINGRSITINTQKCHSYDQQNCLFPQGTIIRLVNNRAQVGGNVFVIAYTYYWEV